MAVKWPKPKDFAVHDGVCYGTVIASKVAEFTLCG
jgi:hypothetical protein